MTGAICGTLCYAAYLLLCSREDVAEALGWVFFWPQYPATSLVTGLGGSQSVATLASFGAVALYYGFGCFSSTRTPATAIVGFVMSGLLFLIWQHWLTANGVFVGVGGFLFWPAALLLLPCKDAGIHHSGWLVLSWASISLVYAIVISGVHFLFLLLRQGFNSQLEASPKLVPVDPFASTSASPNPSPALTRCPQCGRQLRFFNPGCEVRLRCPACKQVFSFLPGNV